MYRGLPEDPFAEGDALNSSILEDMLGNDRHIFEVQTPLVPINTEPATSWAIAGDCVFAQPVVIPPGTRELVVWLDVTQVDYEYLDTADTIPLALRLCEGVQSAFSSSNFVDLAVEDPGLVKMTLPLNPMIRPRLTWVQVWATCGPDYDPVTGDGVWEYTDIFGTGPGNPFPRPYRYTLPRSIHVGASRNLGFIEILSDTKTVDFEDAELGGRHTVVGVLGNTVDLYPATLRPDTRGYALVQVTEATLTPVAMQFRRDPRWLNPGRLSSTDGFRNPAATFWRDQVAAQETLIYSQVPVACGDVTDDLALDSKLGDGGLEIMVFFPKETRDFYYSVNYTAEISTTSGTEQFPLSESQYQNVYFNIAYSRKSLRTPELLDLVMADWHVFTVTADLPEEYSEAGSGPFDLTENKAPGVPFLQVGSLGFGGTVPEPEYAKFWITSEAPEVP